MTTQRIARTWLAARDVIAQALAELRPKIHGRVCGMDERNAEAIIARLAGHTPPLLVCTPDEMKEDAR